MSELTTQKFEARLRQSAAEFAYPPTPDLAASLARRARRVVPRPLVWAALLIVIAVLSLLTVPAARARLAEFLQIGGLQIAPAESLENPTAAVPSSLLFLDGATTLAAAREALDYPVEYPTALGRPDKVYLLDTGSAEFPILIWLEESEVQAALYVLGPDIFLTKLAPEPIRVVTVNGQPGALVAGDRLITDRFGLPVIFVEAPALIWESAAGITYRLEADLSLDELLHIAESIPERGAFP